MGVDSKKLECGPGTIDAGCCFSLSLSCFSKLWGWETVILQLSGFYCSLLELDGNTGTFFLGSMVVYWEPRI